MRNREKQEVVQFLGKEEGGCSSGQQGYENVTMIRIYN